MIDLHRGHSLSIEQLFASAKWAAKQKQWNIIQWNYYRCPACDHPGWFGFDDQGKLHMGMFGAAPVADLIPLNPVGVEVAYKLEKDRIILSHADVDYVVPAGSNYW